MRGRSGRSVGRRLDQILAEQIPTALELRPDLVTLFGGGNDVRRRHGTLLVDLRYDPAARDHRYFGVDRLHLGELGHQRVAAHLLSVLGVDPDPAWLAPLPPAGREPYWRTAARQWDWVRNHVVPAVHGTVRNRLIGRQPGDRFVPKRPELSSVD